MGKKILFSAIGGTDPIRNYRDGAMLHICRNYNPDIVYLYLSGEMCERHEKDNRYGYCLKKLSEKMNHEFDVHYVLDKDMYEVQVFDEFVSKFKGQLNIIKRDYEDAEILINVSSGTPAMKSALQILSAVSEVPMISIQVSTPAKRINPPEAEEEDYKLYWELNEDNEPDFENRCVESKNINYLDVVKREIIIDQIRTCNYTTALDVSEKLAEKLPINVVNLIKAAKYRLELDYTKVAQLLKEESISFIPIKEEKKRNIFEYVLSLEVKIRKNEYADFVRAISPAIVEIFKIALESYAKIDYKDYIKENTTGEKWDLNKLQNNSRLFGVLENSFHNFREGPIYAIHFIPLLREYCSNEKIIDYAEKLRKFEEKARNIAAHNICTITEQWLKSKTGYSTEEIYQLLKKFIDLLNFGIKKEDWDSYDSMNQFIIKQIQEQ